MYNLIRHTMNVTLGSIALSVALLAPDVHRYRNERVHDEKRI